MQTSRFLIIIIELPYDDGWDYFRKMNYRALSIHGINAYHNLRSLEQRVWDNRFAWQTWSIKCFIKVSGRCAELHGEAGHSIIELGDCHQFFKEILDKAHRESISQCVQRSGQKLSWKRINVALNEERC